MQISRPLAFNDIEEKATKLASFLKVSIKGI
jgi:hypothetical protein